MAILGKKEKEKRQIQKTQFFVAISLGQAIVFFSKVHAAECKQTIPNSTQKARPDGEREQRRVEREPVLWVVEKDFLGSEFYKFCFL